MSGSGLGAMVPFLSTSKTIESLIYLWRILSRAWVVNATFAELTALSLICFSSCRSDGEATRRTYHFDRFDYAGDFEVL